MNTNGIITKEKDESDTFTGLKSSTVKRVWEGDDGKPHVTVTMSERKAVTVMMNIRIRYKMLKMLMDGMDLIKGGK